MGSYPGSMNWLGVPRANVDSSMSYFSYLRKGRIMLLTFLLHFSNMQASSAWPWGRTYCAEERGRVGKRS